MAVKKKITSLLLVLVMTLTFVIPASASEGPKHKEGYENVICLEDGSIVEASTSSNGDVYLRQYMNGKLVEEAFIEYGTTEVVSTSYQNDGKTVTVLDSDDCIVVQSQSRSAVSPRASIITKGKITYENTSGEHTAKVQYSSSYVGITTYTIISGTYTVVQLAGLLIAGLGVTSVIATEVAKTIFAWLGLGTTVAGAILGNKTYSADFTSYTYYLTDIATNFTNTMESGKYVINDVQASNKGEVFWDGFNPATCWRDISFGQEVYWHLYGDLAWSIVSWS